jgi:hypothetical protein
MWPQSLSEQTSLVGSRSLGGCRAYVEEIGNRLNSAMDVIVYTMFEMRFVSFDLLRTNVINKQVH